LWGGKGYRIKKPDEVKPVIQGAMIKDKEKPVIIEAYIDPFEPIVPPKVKPEFIRKISESFARGRLYSQRIGLTLYRNRFEVI
jgi:pyruvate dehydrogenase (quinone)